MRKKFIALLVALLMAAALMPTTVLADDGGEVVNIEENSEVRDNEEDVELCGCGGRPKLTIEIVTLDADGNPTGTADGGTAVKEDSTYKGDAAWKITANAANGYYFKEWDGPVEKDEDKNPNFVKRCGNKTVTAYFQQKGLYTLTKEVPTGGGSISNNPSGTSFEKNTKVNVFHHASPGWVFDRWEGVTSDDNGRPCVFMNQNRTVKAYFNRCHYDIVFKVGAHGNWSGGGSADKTVSTAFESVPDAPGIDAHTGYEHTGWSPALAPATGPAEYVAQYACTNYSITYNNLDGATLSGTNPDTYTIESPDIHLFNPTKSGFKFVGWSGTGISGTSKNVTITQGSTGARVYTAVWETESHTVTFRSMGGSAVPSQAVADGGKVIKPDDPTRNGYRFNGWWRILGFVRWDFENDTVHKDISLYADWVKVQTVTFDSKGGSPVPSQTVDWGSYAARPDDPTKPGFEFNGWYHKTCCTTYEWKFNLYPVTLDITLFAKWKAIDYSVVYDANGATSGTVPQDDGVYHIGDTVTVLGNTGNLAMPGATFDGWNTAADGSGTSYLSGSSLEIEDANVKLFAQWRQIDHSVTYDANGATSGSVPEDTSVYHLGDTVTVLANTGSLALDGHTFDGWNTAADGSGTAYAADGAFAMGEADVTLFAQWKIKTFEVTFYKADGVTQIGSTQLINWNGAATLETVPAVEGHAFDKWVLTGDDTAAADSLTHVKENIKAVASYIKNGYTVTFVDYRGEIIGTDGVLHGEAATAPAVPARDGFTFSGWDKPFDNVTSNLTVTAQYAIKKFTVTFVDFDGAELSKQTVNWNTAATAPASPARKGYTFTGWDKDFSKVTADLKVTAQYKLNPADATTDSDDETIPKTFDDGTVTLQDESVAAAKMPGVAWWWIVVAIAAAGAVVWIVIFMVRRSRRTVS